MKMKTVKHHEVTMTIDEIKALLCKFVEKKTSAPVVNVVISENSFVFTLKDEESELDVDE